MVSVSDVIIFRSCVNLVWDQLSTSVRRARDPNTKKTGLRWANERLSRFARSNNPSGSFSHRKRQDEQESGGSDEGGCDEPEDGSGMDGPLQYVDYGEQL